MSKSFAKSNVQALILASRLLDFRTRAGYELSGGDRQVAELTQSARQCNPQRLAPGECDKSCKRARENA
jgi:hypothetical protein